MWHDSCPLYSETNKNDKEMMNFTQLSDKISEKGFRRSTAPRKYFDADGTERQVYDFEHRKRLDMFSVYVDEFGIVESVEFTKVTFDQTTKKFSQKVTKITTTNELNKFLA